MKKACISDAVAPLVDQFFAAPGSFGLLSAWLGVVAYAVQIYCDFSGYTDMALACAGLLGYRLAWNFDFPYLSPDISQFWRRWHMSLSSWLRDYLYIPLGGNRGGRWFVARNLLLTMLLGGLWHGAAWHFVFWGGLHGLALVAHREWRARVKIDGAWWWTAAGTLLTFYWVCVCWVFFRAPDLSAAGTVLRPFLLWHADGTQPAKRRGAVDRIPRIARVDPCGQPEARVRGCVGTVAGLGFFRDVRCRGRGGAAVRAAALCAVHLFPVLNRRGELIS